MGQEPGHGPAALDGPRGQRRLRRRRSQPEQAGLGRVMRSRTKPRHGLQLLGRVLTQTPQPAPQRAQASSPGAISTSMRGTRSGAARRFGRRASSSSSGRRSRPMMAPAARSLDTTRRVELLGAIARGAEPVRAVARERVPDTGSG